MEIRRVLVIKLYSCRLLITLAATSLIAAPALAYDQNETHPILAKASAALLGNVLK